MQTLSVIYVNKLSNLVLDTNTTYSVQQSSTEHKSKLKTLNRLYNNFWDGLHGCNAM